jgi:hypothetical protein
MTIGDRIKPGAKKAKGGHGSSQLADGSDDRDSDRPSLSAELRTTGKTTTSDETSATSSRVSEGRSDDDSVFRAGAT